MRSFQHIILATLACLALSGCNLQQSHQENAEEQHVQVERFALPALNPSDSSAKNALQSKERRFRLEDEKNTVEIFEAAAPGTVFVTQKQIQRTFWQAKSISPS